MAVARPLYGRVAGEAVYVVEPVSAPARRGSPTKGCLGAMRQGLVGRGPLWFPGGGAEGIRSCHQCRKARGVIWCTSCDRRGYSARCISRWSQLSSQYQQQS
ncbi:hypothetical protein Zm00014a_034783 [Zea mays]|uniref:Uncharacterized protein n=1 Tax=Zea mays TaxID=4577 RepID=A0A3L6DJ13_MAIZE|nr:hypothetical protein Zm00014a_034783 [Zea mays]